MNQRYVLISPCRDEAIYIRSTLDAVTAQTVPRALWVIADDGSTDASAEIVGEYAQRWDFIRLVRRENRGHRSVGAGVIEAFYAGLDSMRFVHLRRLGSSQTSLWTGRTRWGSSKWAMGSGVPAVSPPIRDSVAADGKASRAGALQPSHPEAAGVAVGTPRECRRDSVSLLPNAA